MTTISLPTYDQFIEPILRFLAANPEGAPARQVHEAAADVLLLDEQQRQVLLSSGQAVYKNRAGWAHDRLKRAGLSESAKRGFWQLTESGRHYAIQCPSPLSPEKIRDLAMEYRDVKLKPACDAVSLEEELPIFAVAPTETLSPDDRLEEALAELRKATATEILDSLLQVSPNRFEVIVLDVLHRLGYGASRHDLQRVGGSGDAGIDGVISLDKLGLDKVYV